MLNSNYLLSQPYQRCRYSPLEAVSQTQMEELAMNQERSSGIHIQDKVANWNKALAMFARQLAQVLEQIQVALIHTVEVAVAS